jgi:hypothetical protein
LINSIFIYEIHQNNHDPYIDEHRIVYSHK